MPPRMRPSRHGGAKGGRHAGGRDPLAAEGLRALQRQIDAF
jgi:hypothetical protein